MGGARVGAEPNPGDDSKGALAPDEQLREIRPDCCSGCSSSAHHCSRGQYRLKTDHHVLDLAVTGGELSGPSGGNPATDSGYVEALGKMSYAQSVSSIDVGFKIGSKGSGSDLDNPGGHIHLADTLKAGHIHDKAAENGNASSAHSAATTGRGDGNLVRLGEGADGGNFFGTARSGKDCCSAWYRSSESPVQSDRPPISTRLGGCPEIGVDLGYFSQFLEELRRDLNRGSRKVVGGTVQFNWGRGLTHHSGSDVRVVFRRWRRGALLHQWLGNQREIVRVPLGSIRVLSPSGRLSVVPSFRCGLGQRCGF